MFGAKAFALSARKKQHLHKNPGRCPGLLAAAPLGRRWVFVVVRADDLPQPLRRRVAKGSAPTVQRGESSSGARLLDTSHATSGTR